MSDNFAYRDTVIKALTLIRDKNVKPEDAWEHTKGCPKSAFLGLCEYGWVKGIEPTSEFGAETSPNKCYALVAADYLFYRNENKELTPSDLWYLVKKKYTGGAKSHNGQMNVVLALRYEGFLKEGSMPILEPIFKSPSCKKIKT